MISCKLFVGFDNPEYLAKITLAVRPMHGEYVYLSNGDGYYVHRVNHFADASYIELTVTAA